MNISYKKMLLSLSIMALIGYESQTIAAESGAKALENMVEKTDRYKANCPTGTTHLDFQLLDTTATTDTTIAPPPQLVNAVLKKGKLSSTASQIVADSSQELILSGGNGVYSLTLDTNGTNLTVKTAQSYTVQYHCYNSEGGDVNTKLANGLKAGVDSAVKTIKNKAKATLSFNCAKNAKLKTLGNTEKLYIKLTNKTKSAIPAQTSPFLTAQIYNPSLQIATSTTDKIGDENYSEKVSLKGGVGDYYFIVATTATDETKNNAKTYAFQYSCLNDANVEQTATLSQLEDN